MAFVDSIAFMTFIADSLHVNGLRDRLPFGNHGNETTTIANA